MHKKIVLVLWSVVFSFGSLVAFAQQADLKKAEELMRQGKSAEAYKLLKPFELKQAGIVDYDYLLGISALDSGNPDEALNAFERVLAVNPGHMGARLDMGRAYFALGALDLAKQEFERVRAANPPEAARKVTDQYLAAIEERTQQQKRRIGGYLEAGLGYDDNITSATGAFQVGTQQAFGAPFLPTGNAIQRQAGFMTIAGGLDFSAALTDSISFFAGADARQRYYEAKSAPVEPTARAVPGDVPRDNSAYDQQVLDGRIGLSLQADRHVFAVSLRGQRYRQDGDVPLAPGGAQRATSDRDTDALGFDWRYSVNNESTIGAFLSLANNRYPTLSTQDTDQTLFGVSYAHAFQRPGNPLIFISLFKSEDNALRPQNPPLNTTDVSRTLTGMRLFGQYSVQERTDLFALFNYSKRKDDTAFSRSTIIPFGEDDMYEVGIGASWRFMPLWSLRGMVVHTKNESNLDLYSFKRTETTIAVRRDFR